MLKMGYVGYEGHVVMHKAILSELTRLMTASRDLEELTSGLQHLMLDWLLTHILREDRKIAFYTRRAAEESPAGFGAASTPDVPHAVRPAMP